MSASDVGRPIYRMYVDEVGNHDLGPSTDDPNHRYLSLTGVIMDLQHVADVVAPSLEDLKRKHLQSHPDDPVILHRKEIPGAKGPFSILRDADARKAFDRDLLQILRSAKYAVVTATIDKKAHKEQYDTWTHEPYHYCLEVAIERYVLCLEDWRATGDVMAESRGGRLDLALKRAYSRRYDLGTDYVAADRFQRHLTSHELKVKPKSANIAGLQMADLIAHPSFRYMLCQKEGGELAPFGELVASELASRKYRRSPSGAISGWGTKWLP